MTRRQHFLLFVKILMCYLQEHNPGMTTGVKTIVRECTRSSRNSIQGRHDDAALLMHLVAKRLQLFLGATTWNEIKHCFQEFCKRKNVHIMVYRA